METEGYSTLRVRVEDGVAFATIDHPPINLFDVALIVEMDRFGREVEADPDVRVVVVDSANPEFFIAHADVGLILQLPRRTQAKPTELAAVPRRWSTASGRCPRRRSRCIEGRARGGGSELVLGHGHALRRARPRASWPSPRSRSGSSPAAAGRSACRGWSAAAARSR